MVKIDKELCKQCGICEVICPEVFSIEYNQVYININNCNKCGKCIKHCPDFAIDFIIPKM